MIAKKILWIPMKQLKQGARAAQRVSRCAGSATGLWGEKTGVYAVPGFAIGAVNAV